MSATRLLAPAWSRLWSADLAVLAYVVALLSFPVYLLPSGMPQISTFFFMSSALLAYAGNERGLTTDGKVLALIWFALAWWAVAVSGTWAVIEADAQLATFGLYFLFNGIVFAVTRWIVGHCDARAWRLMILALLALLVVLVLVGLLYSGTRFTGSFQNPNQLGYFCILVTSISFTVIRMFGLGRSLMFIVWAAAFLLAVLSLSRSAILCMLAMGMFLLRSGRVTLILAIAGVACLIIFAQEIEFVVSAMERIESIGTQSDDSLAARGYSRIVDYPEYMLLGGGEGAYERWDAVHIVEVHSTFGNLLFCYGIVGFALLVALLTMVVTGGGLVSSMYLAPAILYGLVHNGLRFSLFWVLLAVVSASREIASRNRAFGSAARLPSPSD